MAYALPEKQRAYQREWIKNKKAKSPSIPNLSRGTVTWAELTSLNRYAKFETFKECITEAKAIVLARRVNRIAIATLALRACQIKHGGDRRSTTYDKEQCKGTLIEFASQVGIQYKTLHRWVQVKSFIFDAARESSEFDFTAADIAIKYQATNKDPLAAYYKLKGNSVGRNVYHAIRYSTSVLTALESSHNILSSEQKSIIKKNLKEAMSYL